jgi:hypothetical protein
VFLYEIVSSHGSEDVDVGLLGINAVWTWAEDVDDPL